ncbi:MAG TPA: restriction endonuclease [Burkholderiales bacterium]|jgi:restriction system protein|nr:restriction endonuclease [Burkholderiales bacterium]
MQFKLSQDSLFAILLRSPWWVSLFAAFAAFLLARILLPEHLAPYGAISGLPFVVIAVMAAYKQLRVMSPSRVSATLEAAGALSWKDFSATLEQGLQRDGYGVTRLARGAADFTLAKGGRISVLSARRWKAANHGVEALRELQEVRRAQDASEAIYVAGGALSETAQRYATDNAIRVLQGTELAQLLRGVPLGSKAA